MKGRISSIKRMEIHDGDGLRSTVFFKGCPLRCIWCHNPESISFEAQGARFGDRCIGCRSCEGKCGEDAQDNCPTGAYVYYGREYSSEELADILMRDEPFFRNSGGGVTLSGGECLAQGAFATELAQELHRRGISVYVDTCGIVKREVLDGIIPFTDVFLYDIKAIDPSLHIACTGVDNALILDNLRHLSEMGCKIEIRYPLVMGYNDGECDAIGRFLSSLDGIERVKVLQYHSYAGSRYDALGMVNTLPCTVTSYEDVERMVQHLRSFGLNAVNGALDDR